MTNTHSSAAQRIRWFRNAFMTGLGAIPARQIRIAAAVLVFGAGAAAAQTPVLGSVEAPYANLQTAVRMAGQSYGPGAVGYGPAGTPLVLTGMNLGDTGTVEFIAYQNGVVDTNVSPVMASPTMWTSNMIFVP